MKLGIISDTHDRVERIAAALEVFRRGGVERIIHCGDTTRPQTVESFRGWTIDFVLGNCDWQPELLRDAISSIGGTLHDNFGELTLQSKTIAWIHSDDASLFRSLENANHYDFLFYGHTHVAERHRTGKTLVCNPGAIHRVRKPSVCILDLVSDELQSFEVLEE